MPKAKKTPFEMWETKNNDGIEKRYIRLGVTLMASEAMRNLSSSAFKVLCYMKLESAGKRSFKFPYNKYASYMTKPTFQKAKQELIEKGFIEVVQNNRNLRTANIYMFSDRWKSI